MQFVECDPALGGVERATRLVEFDPRLGEAVQQLDALDAQPPLVPFGPRVIDAVERRSAPQRVGAAEQARAVGDAVGRVGAAQQRRQLVEVDGEPVAVEAVAAVIGDERVAKRLSGLAGRLPQARLAATRVGVGPERFEQSVACRAIRVQREVGDQLARRGPSRQRRAVERERAEQPDADVRRRRLRRLRRPRRPAQPPAPPLAAARHSAPTRARRVPAVRPGAGRARTPADRRDHARRRPSRRAQHPATAPAARHRQTARDRL
nr:hypothetical protein [Conexibacter woesei]